ncbi:unnamed protein product, partial [Tetraodon nigroviridis]
PVSSEDLKKNQKAASSVDLTKTDSLRKNSQDGRCVCGSVNVCADTFGCFWLTCSSPLL